MSLSENNVDPDPIRQFRAWWDEARATGYPWADAMVLATVTPTGSPSARAVILRGLDEGGFVFFTDTRSAKGVDLAATPEAALVFLWAPLERQVRVPGQVAPIPDAAADAFFATRPREANLASHVAPQGVVVAGGRAALERRLAELVVEYEGQPVGRPPGGGGYRLVPEEIEFWQGRADHLHDRLCYRRGAGRWEVVRLAP